MKKRVLKRSLCGLLVIFLTVPFTPWLFPGIVRAETLLQLTDQSQPDYKPKLTIDNLEFTHFSVPLSGGIDLSNISVTTFGEGTLKPGLEFALNGELSVTASMRTLRILYTVEHLRGDFIVGSSLSLGEVTTSGDNAMVLVGEQIACGQADTIIRDVLYKLDQNQSTQLWDGKFKTPKAVLRPTVNLQVKALQSGEDSSLDSFEQVFSLAPMIDAGDDRVVFDQVTLEASGTPIDGSYAWQLYELNGDDLDPVGDEPLPGEKATFSDLEYGFYVAKLTVTSQAVSAIDFVNIYAAGPCDEGSDAKTHAELNLWNFELKKYKYCKWSTARILGTFGLPDGFEFNRGDDLVGKVTVEINREGKPVIVMSDELKVKVKNWKYKSVIHGHGR